MTWYHLLTPDREELDEFAKRFHLHPLHVEDVRSDDERVKVEGAPHYTFALLKTLCTENPSNPVLATVSIFAGHPTRDATRDATGDATSRAGASEPDPGDATADDENGFFLIIADTRRAEVAAALRRAEQEKTTGTPGRLLYLVFDSIVDSYFPAIDALDDKIDALEDRVINPSRNLLDEIFDVKRQLVDARRLLVSTRDASMHLQRDGGIPLDSEHQLYLRDLYDHISRLLDTVETQRDLLNNALDIYLSSIANRTNEVMKVLTVLSTIALPALVMTGVYGMNVKGLPFLNSNYAAEYVAGITLLMTCGLLGLLRYLRWF